MKLQVARDGVAFATVDSPEALKTLVAVGRVRPDDHVFADFTGQWCPVSEFIATAPARSKADRSWVVTLLLDKLKLILIAAAGVALMFWFLIRSQDAEDDAPRRAPHPSASSAPYNSAVDGSVFQVADYVKHHLKDPGSYQSIDWSPVTEKDFGYTVRHKYRAKNSFGGYNVEEHVFLMDSKGNVTGMNP